MQFQSKTLSTSSKADRRVFDNDAKDKPTKYETCNWALERHHPSCILHIEDQFYRDEKRQLTMYINAKSSIPITLRRTRMGRERRKFNKPHACKKTIIL